MMEDPDSERFEFHVEWVNSETGFKRPFLLHYFPLDGTVELFDLKTKKIFLKRCKVLDIKETDFYLNNRITIFGRLMTIIDYGDLRTKNKLCKRSQTTVAVIKPYGMLNIGGILRKLYNCGFTILKCRMILMSKEQASAFYSYRLEESCYPLLVENIIRGPVLTILLMGENAIYALRQAMGPADPAEACKVDPTSIRALYGKDQIVNAFHGCSCEEELQRNVAMFFPLQPTPELQSCYKLKNSTLCLVKPHAIREGLLGDIIHAIMECKFDISGMEMFTLDTVNAQEFLEVYKGVVPDYTNMVAQLASGPCIAIEITTPDFNEETPQMFRKFVGPPDPDLARQLRPNTLRAMFGRTKIENAIHCTDLPEDGLLEVEYFFKILQF